MNRRLKPLFRQHRRRRGLAASILLLAMMAPCRAPAAAETPTRSDVLIREVILSDQTRRYSVPVAVDGTLIEAGFDTGSTGLRLLPGAADATPGTAPADRYGFGSGIVLDGVTVERRVRIGDLEAAVVLQQVRHVGCAADVPTCPASRIRQDQYGLLGNGLKGEGFRAIIGIGTGAAEIAQPLVAAGAARWIVALPRPGEQEPGHLILNPAEAELQGFVPLAADPEFSQRPGPLRDTVTGCLIDRANGAKACGAVMMDTGAPGILVVNGGLGETLWPNGTPAVLLFDAATGSATIGQRFEIGYRSQASHLSFGADAQYDHPIIFAGLAPYFAFSVLYDPGRRQIAVKPRPPAASEPGMGQ